LKIPSPQLASTSTKASAFLNGRLLFKSEAQHGSDTHLILFANPGFFKFCAVTRWAELTIKAERVLSLPEFEDFLSSGQFDVVTFKLKVLHQEGTYKGNLQGLFLLLDPKKNTQRICAHIHFGTDASHVGRINFVGYLMQQIIYG